MMLIDEKFAIGQTVFLHTDPDQFPRIVTGYVVRPQGIIEYKLSSGESETVHFDIEISVDQSVFIRSSY